MFFSLLFLQKNYENILFLFMILCSLVCLIVIIFNTYYFADNSFSKIGGVILEILAILSFLLLLVLSIKNLVVLLKDYRCYKLKKYETVTAVVLRFKQNREPESGVQINDKPVIKIMDTNEEIILNINDKLIVGDTYTFDYLKNSKIAEISDKITK